MIVLRSSGLYSSLQDLGRFAHRASGVPVSGAMDVITAKQANSLVGNGPTTAVLEITLQGPVLHFEAAAVIAITGAGFSPSVDSVSVAMYTTLYIEKGSTLRFGNVAYGVHAYVAIAGGFKTTKVLGSYSMCKHITKQERLLKGATLAYNRNVEVILNNTQKLDMSLFTAEILEVYPGPEFDTLSLTDREKLLSTKFYVTSDSNRMAFTLEGLENVRVSEIITAPVQPGTVQLMPSGKCAVLMRDAQTTGGYARVLQLTDHAICVLSQKRAGSVVCFTIVIDK